MSFAVLAEPTRREILDLLGRGVNVAGAALRVTPAQGPVKTRAVISGSGFPSNQPLALIWGTQAGSRVSGNGFAPKELELARRAEVLTGKDVNR